MRPCGKSWPTGLADLRALVDEYERLAHQQLDKAGLKRLDDLQHRIDELDGWRIDQRVELMMTEMMLPPDQPIGELSGGWRRRVGLAKALISKPDLLLLDEPTNHLDIVTIQWLENRIRSWQGAVLFITHDRAFLDKLATRICELDRGPAAQLPGQLRRVPGAQGEDARGRGHGQQALRQEAGRGGNLDPPGREGPAAPEPEPRAAPGRPAPGVRRPAIAAEPGADLHRDGGAVGPQGHRGEARHPRLPRRGAHQGLLLQDHARRPDRPARQQRRRQEHAAAHPARRTHAAARA